MLKAPGLFRQAAAQASIQQHPIHHQRFGAVQLAARTTRFWHMHSNVNYWYGNVAVCVPMAGPVSRCLLGIHERCPSLLALQVTPDTSRPG